MTDKENPWFDNIIDLSFNQWVKEAEKQFYTDHRQITIIPLKLKTQTMIVSHDDFNEMGEEELRARLNNTYKPPIPGEPKVTSYPDDNEPRFNPKYGNLIEPDIHEAVKEAEVKQREAERFLKASKARTLSDYTKSYTESDESIAAEGVTKIDPEIKKAVKDNKREIKRRNRQKKINRPSKSFSFDDEIPLADAVVSETDALNFSAKPVESPWLSFQEAEFYKEYMKQQEQIWIVTHARWRAGKYKEELKNIYKQVRKEVER